MGGKRKELAGTGRDPVGKTAVVGAKDRATNQVAAKVVTSTGKETLQGFVKDHAAAGAKVYTDEAKAYGRCATAQIPHERLASRSGSDGSPDLASRQGLALRAWSSPVLPLVVLAEGRAALLDWAPPGFASNVPVDRFAQAAVEPDLRLPPQRAQFGGV